MKAWVVSFTLHLVFFALFTIARDPYPLTYLLDIRTESARELPRTQMPERAVFPSRQKHIKAASLPLFAILEEPLFFRERLRPLHAIVYSPTHPELTLLWCKKSGFVELLLNYDENGSLASTKVLKGSTELAKEIEKTLFSDLQAPPMSQDVLHIHSHLY